MIQGSKILILIDASIGKEFLTNDEFTNLIYRIKNNPGLRDEIFFIKQSQIEKIKPTLKEFFIVKDFPRKSIKKAIKLSTVIIYLTDGNFRHRKLSILNRIRNNKDKFVISIKIE